MNNKKVIAFVGQRAEIVRIYEATKNVANVDIYVVGGEYQLRTSTDDYVKTVAVGSCLMQENSQAQWVDPSGTRRFRFNETADRINKIQNKGGVFVAFSGFSQIEISTIGQKLLQVNIPSTCVMNEKTAEWQLMVKPEDYFEAVTIGSKFAEWKFRGVKWNDPTGVAMFNMKELANNARTELDEVLEA